MNLSFQMSNTAEVNEILGTFILGPRKSFKKTPIRIITTKSKIILILLAI